MAKTSNLHSMLLNLNNTVQFCIALLLFGCGSSQKIANPPVSQSTKLTAIKTLNEIMSPSTNATISSSDDIDWPAGILPWDRFTLPVLSPNGLHAIIQLGESPPVAVLCGDNNEMPNSTSIELHVLDPMRGRRISPLRLKRPGLILGRFAHDNAALVESPNGEHGRWIGQIDWATGALDWLVADDAINCFPTMNVYSDLAWSRREKDENRFHLVIKTPNGQQVIDDNKSDWLLPRFIGIDKLRAFKILDGQLSLVEFDLRAKDPLLTSISLPLLNSGATRAIAWQIATTNPSSLSNETYAFYHPIRKRMMIWQPNQSIETVFLAPNSVAAAPVEDGSWLVATKNRLIRQEITENDGVHIRNRIAIPIATTSKKWTHLLLVPDGNRLQVRAINLGE